MPLRCAAVVENDLLAVEGEAEEIVTELRPKRGKWGRKRRDTHTQIKSAHMHLQKILVRTKREKLVRARGGGRGGRRTQDNDNQKQNSKYNTN
jgi:hypothetical protein